MTLGCGDVPKEKAKEAARKTAETGNEHGFYFCANGESGPIKEGNEKSIKIDGDCGGSKVGIFHTHPNDIAHLSDKDREALDIDEIGAVCAGDTDENMKCEIENKDMSCVRDFSDGTAAGSPDSDVLEAIESAGGVVFGEPDEFERLPKNSKCQEWKDVASKSDYHDSDTVKRCAHYDTGGDSNGGGGSGGDDGGDDGTPPYKDDDGNFTDERMKNAFYWAAQIRGWMIEGPHAGIRGTYCVEIQAGQPIIVLDKDEWNESSVNALVDSYHDHNFPRSPPKDVKELDDEWRVFVEPTDDRLQSNYADEWKDIDPTCTDEHPDEQTEDTDPNGGDGGEDDGEDVSGEEIAGWTPAEPQGDESDRWEATIELPFNGETDAYVSVGPYETSRGGDDQDPYYYERKIGDRNSSTKVKNSHQRAKDAAESWMQDNPPESFETDVPGDTNGWERVMHNESGEHRKHRTVWERWRKPTPTFPDRRKEQVEVHKRDGGKWTTRYRFTDADGEDLDNKSRDLPNLPNRTSMSGRSKGKVNKWSKPDRPLSLVTEYIEENAPEKADWGDIPEFNIETEMGNVKPCMSLIKRVAPSDPTGRSKLSGIRVTNTSLEFRGTDNGNAGMFDIDMSVAGFETKKHNREAWKDSAAETGKGAFDAYALADYLTDKNMSDSVKIETMAPRETNDPYQIMVDHGDLMIPIWDEWERSAPDMPDLDFDASFTLEDASELQDALKAADGDTDSSGDNSPPFVIEDADRPKIKWDGGKAHLEARNSGGGEESTYSIDVMRNYTMSIPRPTGKDVNVDFAEEFPMKLMHKVGIHHCNYLIAPRIQTDEPAEEIAEEDSCPFELEQHEPAPEFEGKNQNGETVSPDWGGQNVVYTYPNDQGCRCSVTAAEIDDVAAKEGFDAYGVSTDGVESKREFAEKLDLSHELISDPDGEIVEKFGLSLDENGNAPRALFKIEDGEIVDSTTGERPTLEQPDLYPEAEGTDSKMLEHFEHPSVAVITGKRGSGKSSLSYKIAEDMYRESGVTPVTIGLPEHMQRKFPEHWEHEQDPREAPPDSTLVIDEAYQKYHSRRSGQEESVSMSQLINLSRHCQRSILFVSQNSSYLEKSAASEADYLLMKEPGNFHSDFERRQFKQLVKTAENAYDNLPENMDNEMYTYVYGDEADELIRTYEAPWYDDDLSKGYSAMCSEAYSDKAVDDAELTADAECPFGDD